MQRKKKTYLLESQDEQLVEIALKKLNGKNGIKICLTDIIIYSVSCWGLNCITSREGFLSY